MCCHDQLHAHHLHGGHAWPREEGYCCSGHHDEGHRYLASHREHPDHHHSGRCCEEGHDTPRARHHVHHYSPFPRRHLSKEALVEELKAKRSALKEALGYVERFLADLEEKAPGEDPSATEA